VPAGMFVAGGLTGLDNMHPTVPGYALIAQAVVDALVAAGRAAQANPIDLEAAYARDSLLTHLPAFEDLVSVELALLGGFAMLGGIDRAGPTVDTSAVQVATV